MLDYHTDETFPNLRECLECFKDGLALYRLQDWDRAESAFRDAVRHNPTDDLAGIYLKRISYMRAHPPGEAWDGVWVMKNK